MRKAIVLLAALAAIGASRPVDYAPYPAPLGYVTDLADVLSEQDETQIKQSLIRADNTKKVQFVVVTIRSMSDYPGTQNESIEEFSKGLFNKWGIGRIPKNDGVLLLVSVKDRKARISLGAGYPESRDADANRIMQETIVPEFKKGDYAAGIRNGVKAILKEFAGQ